MRSLLLVPLAATLLAGCATTPVQREAAAAEDARDAAKLEQALAGYTPGKPLSCVRTDSSFRVESYGNTILYRSGRLIYRSDTNGGCNGIKRGDIIVTRSTIAQQCSGDIVRTLDQATRFQTGACSFGEFVPYRKGR